MKSCPEYGRRLMRPLSDCPPHKWKKIRYQEGKVMVKQKVCEKCGKVKDL